MANSRSNIYPVQLQGAELNLNKFDAEIKQYSGFNKNNSPFVGGCLSNLFTKTEENTTGSSDSVYVDDNGDVYTATLEGLYKNGELVLSNSELNRKAINIYEADFPENVVFYDYDRYTKIEYFYYQDGYLIKRCARNVDTGEVITDEDAHLVNNRMLDGDIYIKTYTSMMFNSEGEIFKDIYYRSATKKYYIRITVVTGHGRHQLSKEYLVDAENFIDCPCHVSSYSAPDFIVVPNIIGVNDVFFYNGSADFIYYVTPTFYNENPELPPASTNIGDYVFLEHYAFLVRANNVVINNTPKQIPLSLSVILRGWDEEARCSVSADLLTHELKYTTSATVNFSIGTFENEYVFSNAGVCYAIKTSDNKNFWGVCGGDFGSGGETTANITLREDSDGNKHPMLEMGCRASGMVLANNGYVSGIKSEINEILLTEWNSINKDYIFNFYVNTGFRAVLYRNETSKKYYKIIYNEDVKIKYLDGLIVVNWDSKENCYRISDRKKMFFAPSWNNRAPILNTFTFSSPVTDNAYYMASSVNEYNLKDNASILLNPIPVITDVLAIVNNTKITKVDAVGVKVDPITYRYNYYSGSDSEILYKGTTEAMFRYFIFNDDLEGLPFPINTSGNVQLSPSLFCKTERFGNDVFIKEGSNAYQLIKDGAESVMSYYLGTLIENLEDIFILQGQYYAIINKQIFNVQFSGGVVQSLSFVVSVENLQFCGNSAYQAYFFSKTNRCIYVFTGANILNQLQLVDKISEIYAYKYNQSTQSIILITDLGTIVSSNLGMYLIEGFTPDDVFFYDKGVVFVSDSELTYLQYYEADGFEKHNIEVDTCFYGMNNETVTINDCLYFRLFSEEHEEGEVKVSATTISLKGRKTETTVFKFKASDWDALTHSVYVRYQPKEQRGLGISFSINSPFKIASLSVGSKADAILVDKVSKGAVITPSNNDEW